MNLYNNYQKKKKEEKIRMMAERDFGVKTNETIIVYENQKNYRKNNFLLFIFFLFLILGGIVILSVLASGQDISSLLSAIFQYFHLHIIA